MSASTPDQPIPKDGELQRDTAAAAPPASPAIPIADPVANQSATSSAQQWQDLCSLEEIPDGGILTLLQSGQNVLVYRNGAEVTCMPNECPHRGWPLDGALVRDGIMMCPYHGYDFRLATGECITDPSLPLDLYPIRIRDGRVDVRLK
jgi:nitrite reductase/ring-hydroxylating ferredoxin subunit